MKRVKCRICGKDISTEVQDSFELQGKAVCNDCDPTQPPRNKQSVVMVQKKNMRRL